MIVTPITYQGGKSRIAKDVADVINWNGEGCFYDLCCGSGAISIEQINRGTPNNQIIMVDAGPFGEFWSKIGCGTYDLSVLKAYIDAIPSEPKHIQPYLLELSKQDATVDTAYVFPLLQAGSFGGKAIWSEGIKWRNTSFRSYWLPTETSSRRSPVNPMMPMPKTLYERISQTVDKMCGVKAYRRDINELEFSQNKGVIYIDPPYDSTTGYGHTVDIKKLVEKTALPVFVSEASPLSDNAVQIIGERAKGGISGTRKKSHEEWLSKFN